MVTMVARWHEDDMEGGSDFKTLSTWYSRRCSFAEEVIAEDAAEAGLGDDVDKREAIDEDVMTRDTKDLRVVP